MNEQPPAHRRADRLLLLEAALALLLLGLFLALYYVPSRRPGFTPDVWVWPLLVGLFFGILLLERWRRKHGARPPLDALSGGGPTGPEPRP